MIKEEKAQNYTTFNKKNPERTREKRRDRKTT
jgi:hypothetical protein